MLQLSSNLMMQGERHCRGPRMQAHRNERLPRRGCQASEAAEPHWVSLGLAGLALLRTQQPSQSTQPCMGLMNPTADRPGRHLPCQAWATAICMGQAPQQPQRSVKVRLLPGAFHCRRIATAPCNCLMPVEVYTTSCSTAGMFVLSFPFPN